MKKEDQSSETKRMRCKYCGHIQPVDQSFCEACGHDMALYGEVVKSPGQGGGGAKRHLLLPAVMCVLLALGAVFWFSNRDAARYQSAESSAQTIAAAETETAVECYTSMATAAETAQLPDFLAFADGRVVENHMNQYDQRYSFCYDAENEDVRPVFDEYLSLLESRYPYQQTGTFETAVEDWEYFYYWFSYTGPSEVTDLTMNILSGAKIERCNIWAVFTKHLRTGKVSIFVGGANEIPYCDNGDRTTVQP